MAAQKKQEENEAKDEILKKQSSPVKVQPSPAKVQPISIMESFHKVSIP